jgi:hypothetical protein
VEHAEYPLFFTYRDLIHGKGYAAGVVVDGRALLREEDDGFWMYGVNPGGVAGSGHERAAAFHDFRLGYRSVLVDIAEEAPSFEAFADGVRSFFYEVNRPNERDWLVARDAVRSGKVTADLPRVEDAREAQVHVVLVERFEPAANPLDEEAPETLAA